MAKILKKRVFSTALLLLTAFLVFYPAYSPAQAEIWTKNILEGGFSCDWNNAPCDYSDTIPDWLGYSAAHYTTGTAITLDQFQYAAYEGTYFNISVCFSEISTSWNQPGSYCETIVSENHYSWIDPTGFLISSPITVTAPDNKWYRYILFRVDIMGKGRVDHYGDGTKNIKFSRVSIDNFTGPGSANV